MSQDTFNTTGSEQTWTAPHDETSIDVDVQGAEGGAGSGDGGVAGLGARVEETISVTGGETLYVYVGGQGTTGGAGGFNGGGSGADADPDGGGGGGGSDIRQGGNTLSDRIVIAGGGGGGGGEGAIQPDGGDGGGTLDPNGEDGLDGGDDDTASGGGGGGGGTQSSGGTGGTDIGSDEPQGEDGSLGVGGNGTGSSVNGAGGGGGGGGGYYGGGGGQGGEYVSASDKGGGGGGGGGSSKGAGSATITASYNSGDGVITISYTPGSPTNVSTTTVSGDQVDLSWDTTVGADDYEVYRADSSGSSSTADYTKVGTVADGGGSSESFSDTGLEDGEKFYYRVRAIADDGTNSALSAEVTATTTLSAPSLDSLDTGTENEITVNYTLNDDSSDNVVEIYRSTDGSLGSKQTTISDLTKTMYTDTSVLDGEKYYYTVRRVTDHASEDSTQLAGTTPLPAPSNVSTSRPATGEITVSWTDEADNEDGYRAFISTDGGSTFTQDGGDLSAGTSSYTFTKLSIQTEYTFKIRVFTEDKITDSGTVSTEAHVVGRRTRP